MSYRIGIWDRDNVYSSSLMEYLNCRTRNLFKATAFSGETALREYLCNKELDLLIVDECFRGKDFGVPMVYVCEHKYVCDENTSIYKYQNVQGIAEKMKKILGKKESLQGVTIYGVYSPLGRCGKTTLAKSICNYFSNSLYVNMEEYPEEVDQSGNSDVFWYYIANNNPEALRLVEKLQKEADGTKNILGVSSYLDMRQISYDNMKWLVDMLRANMDFSKVVFDIGQAVLMDMSILTVFDKVIVPELEDNSSIRKLQLFKKNISSVDGLAGKLFYVQVVGQVNETKLLNEIIEREEI